MTVTFKKKEEIKKKNNNSKLQHSLVQFEIFHFMCFYDKTTSQNLVFCFTINSLMTHRLKLACSTASDSCFCFHCMVFFYVNSEEFKYININSFFLLQPSKIKCSALLTGTVVEINSLSYLKKCEKLSISHNVEKDFITKFV